MGLHNFVCELKHEEGERWDEGGGWGGQMIMAGFDSLLWLRRPNSSIVLTTKLSETPQRNKTKPAQQTGHQQEQTGKSP